MEAQAFTLDTSGLVPSTLHLGGLYRWSDLDPFTQGYIEALFADLTLENVDGSRVTAYGFFSDLAPKTLAAILKDCEAAPKTFYRNTPEDGREFWRRRNQGLSPGFPPLTPYLGDDGKVYLRGAA